MKNDSNEDKLNVVSLISQEIRVPLNAIVGISDLILRQDLSPKVREHSLNMRKYVMNMVSIINDLSDINLLQKGKLELQNVPVELEGLIENINEYMSRWIMGKDVTFVVHVDPKVPAIFYGDFDRLRQIILNLLSNAVKYTEKGVIELHIKSRDLPGKKGSKVFDFAVKDTGMGIKAEELDGIFDVFYNNEAKKKYSKKPGMGLGLAIVAELTKLMGAKVAVNSVFGEGTEFTLSAELAAATNETYSDLPPGHYADLWKGMEFYAPDARVLIVDDYEINVEILKEALEIHKIKAGTATNGQEAIDSASLKYYDLIFMDYMMPVIDGAKAAKVIREKGYRGHIVAITADVESATQEFIINSGMDDVLLKPVEISEVESKLLKWLPHRKLKKATDVKKEPEALAQVASGLASMDLSDISERSKALLSSLNNNNLDFISEYDDFRFGWTVDYAFLDIEKE